MATASIFEILNCVTRFGRLTVVGEDRGPHGHRIALCKCDCGGTARPTLAHLRNGHSTSCGCHGASRGADRARTHGRARTPEYAAWSDMKTRCYNPNVKNFADYGGRGIAVCDRWRDSFEAFLADMGNRPSPLHSLDRIDNNRGYEPGNCRWHERTAQNRNRRTTVWFEHDGRRMSLPEAVERYGVPAATIRMRMKLGWSVADVLTRPVRRAAR